MNSRRKHTGFVLRQLILLMLSAGFLLVFSRYTTPLTTMVGGDAAFFQMVGQGMTRGYLPYRDFFDMKGPWLFLIEWLGQCISYGRAGIFILQVLNLYLSLFFVDRIISLVSRKASLPVRLMLVVPFLWIAAVTFEGGNLTEEFSLPWLLGCFFCCLKYIGDPGNKRLITFSALFCGFSFGLLALIRITNAASIAAICLFIGIALLRARDYASILRCAVFFIAGTALSAAPAWIYCLKHGILSDMLYCVFDFGFRYAHEGGLLSIRAFRENPALCAQLLIPFAAVLALRKRDRIGRSLLALTCINTALLAFVLCMGNAYPHYFTLCLPGLAVGVYALCREASASRFAGFIAAHRFRLIAAALLLCLLYPHATDSCHVSKAGIIQKNTHRAAREISAEIPPEDSDQVFVYGKGSSAWYGKTGLFPCIKYCDWQDHYIQLMPEIQNELEQVFDTEPPKWLITHVSQTQPEFIQNVIRAKYLLQIENNSHRLYKLAISDPA